MLSPASLKRKHGTNHSCGVMILIKDDLEFNLKSSVLDAEGRYILMDATVQGSDFLFVNIYAPNKVQYQCEFFSALDTLIEKFLDSAEKKNNTWRGFQCYSRS